MNTIHAIGRYLLNKAAAIVLLLVLLAVFHGLPTEAPTPFAELLYVSILIIGVTVVAPLVRLLVFPEAAEFAEGPYLREHLNQLQYTPALLHYWFATFISYAIPIACAATLQH